MHKCPYCQFENEEGALFCEQCKSDLGPAQAVAVAEPAEDVGPGEIVPVARPADERPAEKAGEAVAAAAAGPGGGNGQEASSASAAPHAAPEAQPEPAASAPAPGGPAVAQETPPPASPSEEQPAALPRDARPRLVVLRGLKINVEYPLYEGLNFIGRADEKPVDIDLEDQEPPDRVWSSRQHAVISLEEGRLSIEDLNSSNGTFVNRTRLYPGQKRPLQVDDVIHIGTVQMKVRA